MWDVEATIVSVIIGTLEPIPLKVRTYMKKIGLKPNIPTLQISALLGTLNIL